MNILPDLPTFLSFLLATVLLAITPGPDMTLFLGRALAFGRTVGLMCVFGAVCGIAVHTFLVAFGLSALIVASPTAFTLLKISGAIYLFWLAVQALRNGSSFQMSSEVVQEKSLLRHWSDALAINLLNPKIIIFFMTFLPQFISAGDDNAQGRLLFFGLMFIVISVPVVVPMILVADRLSQWLKAKPRVTRVIDYLFAAVFSIFAVRILLTGAK